MSPTLPLIYGTLCDPDILAAVLGRTVAPADLLAAEAPGHAAVCVPGEVFPALVARAGASAPGLLLAPLSRSDRTALDAFEGELYCRKPLAVRSGGALQTAEAYLPTIPIPPDARPWTLATWQAQNKPHVLVAELQAARRARLT